MWGLWDRLRPYHPEVAAVWGSAALLLRWRTPRWPRWRSHGVVGLCVVVVAAAQGQREGFAALLVAGATLVGLSMRTGSAVGLGSVQPGGAGRVHDLEPLVEGLMAMTATAWWLSVPDTEVILPAAAALWGVWAWDVRPRRLTTPWSPQPSSPHETSPSPGSPSPGSPSPASSSPASPLWGLAAAGMLGPVSGVLNGAAWYRSALPAVVGGLGVGVPLVVAGVWGRLDRLLEQRAARQAVVGVHLVAALAAGRVVVKSSRPWPLTGVVLIGSALAVWVIALVPGGGSSPDRGAGDGGR